MGKAMAQAKAAMEEFNVSVNEHLPGEAGDWGATIKTSHCHNQWHPHQIKILDEVVDLNQEIVKLLTATEDKKPT